MSERLEQLLRREQIISRKDDRRDALVQAKLLLCSCQYPEFYLDDVMYYLNVAKRRKQTCGRSYIHQILQVMFYLEYKYGDKDKRLNKDNLYAYMQDAYKKQNEIRQTVKQLTDEYMEIFIEHDIAMGIG